ncbi:MAG: DegT/DnrJ/EryC1/StrS family aminotransferase [Saprospiraceae bacterium]|nr:DegT/DnrJ/EryC1/StrS family aminotransferase [Saprospiraceae bacterium]
MKPRVKFYDPVREHAAIRTELDAAYHSFMEAGSLILGNKVKEFELWSGQFLSQRFCVGVNSGLDALIIALKALGIGEGDEVLVPANTYIACWLAISATGAKPVGIEPDPETMNITAQTCLSKITGRTKAIMPVHLYGLPCDMPEFLELANNHGLFIIEDNAQAFGACLNNKKTGSFGIINAHSFYPTKNLGALGDGGLITTNDQNLYEWALKFRNYGSTLRYINDIQGVNSRLDELQASWLLVKSQRLDEQLNKRRELARQYTEAFKDTGDLILPQTNREHTYHIYAVRTRLRNELADYLRSKDIDTVIHYPVPPHLQNCNAIYNYVKGDFPISEELADTVLSLPLYPSMGEDQHRVISAVKQFFKKQ